MFRHALGDFEEVTAEGSSFLTQFQPHVPLRCGTSKLPQSTTFLCSNLGLSHQTEVIPLFCFLVDLHR